MAKKRFTTRSTEVGYGCAAEPREYFGSGPGSAYAIWCASLDDIAKQADEEAGTLYRHFPTRDALIEAVYWSEVEKLADAEGKFAEGLSPVEALRRELRLRLLTLLRTRRRICFAWRRTPLRGTLISIQNENQTFKNWT
jgi:AcrR family transcriptional regulator